MRATILPGVPQGTVQIPASKSMAHRALICAALANGESLLSHVTRSNDIDVTQRAMTLLGAQCRADAPETVRVQGCGGVAQNKVSTPVFCGESGSTLRFLIPLFSLTGASVRFTAEGRLPQRPQSVYADLFAQRGLVFEPTADGIALDGALTPGSYVVNGNVSSQFISGLLLALPLLNADSTIRVTPPFESRSYVNLTLQSMRDFGVQADWQDAYTLFVPGGQQYQPADYTVEGDFSQAAFFAVLGAVRGGITVSGLRADSLQGDKVVLDVLRRCGAQWTQTVQPNGQAAYCFEAAPLTATEIDLADCPDLGPILMVLGLFCSGETVLRNAGRLRVKESDRIAAMEAEIRKMGGDITSTQDTVTVRGSMLHGAEHLGAHNDHRVAMAMSIAGLAAGVSVAIEGAQAVAKSYPHFFETLVQLGVQVKQDETN